MNLQEVINIQAEQVNAVDADRQKAAGKTKADLESTVASKAKAIADLKNELGQSIVDKLRPVEDRPVNEDGNIQGLNKTCLLGSRESVLFFFLIETCNDTWKSTRGSHRTSAVCEMSFTQSGSCKGHKARVHTGILPHACSFCDAQFATMAP